MIRPATQSDLPAIIAIYAADPITGPGEQLADPLPASYTGAFQRLTADPNQVLLVAELDRRIVGTVQLSYIQHVFNQGFRRCVLEAIFLHPDVQGRGIGSSLIEHCKTLARAAGCTALELTSNKLRSRAHAFYQRHGFIATHEGFKLPL